MSQYLNMTINDMINKLLTMNSDYKELEGRYYRLKERYKANKSKLQDQAQELTNHATQISELLEESKSQDDYIQALINHIRDLEEQLLEGGLEYE